MSKRILLLISLAFLSLGGMVGGVAFIAKPDGSILQTPLELLEHAPVSDYFWPGVFLLIFMCIWPAINFYGLVRRKQWASVSNKVLGTATILWIVYESVTIQTFSPLQPIIFSVGLILLFVNPADKQPDNPIS